MKEVKSIVLVLVLGLSSHFLAAQPSYTEAYNERDGLLSNFLAGKITSQKAFERSKSIHAYFRQNNYPVFAQEERMYEGIRHFYSGNYAKAVAALENGISAIRPKNDTLIFKYTCLLAEIHRQQLGFDKAEEGFQKAYRQINNSIEAAMPNEVISFYNNYSLLLNKLGETELEKLILDRAYVLAKSEKDSDYQGLIEGKLARYYIQKKIYLSGENYLKESIIHASRPFLRLYRLLSLADLYVSQKRWADFNKTLQLAKRDYAQIKDVSAENIQYGVRIKLLESVYLLSQNRKSQAIIRVNEAVKLAFTYGTKSQFLAKSYLALGDLSKNEAALNYYNSAIVAVTKSGKYYKDNFGDVLFPREFMEAMRKLAAV